MLKASLLAFFLSAAPSAEPPKASAPATLTSVTLEYRLAPGEKAPEETMLAPVYRPDGAETTMQLKPVIR
jgi:hypothetical protein